MALHDEDYVYAVARIHSREQNLLTESFMGQLIAAPDEAACRRLLAERGWTGASEDEMLSAQTDRTWQLIAELVPDMSAFDVFLIGFDYHNLKAAIKEFCRAGSHPGIYAGRGTVSAETIRKAVDENDLTLLPESMRAPAKEAKEALLKTRDGQLCDLILDKAALCRIKDAGVQAGDPLFAQYGELTVAAADIKIAVRAMRTGKKSTFYERALAPCATLNLEALTAAALDGFDAICTYLEKTAYLDAVPALRESMAAFERWCDNLLIGSIRPQLHNAFGLGPLGAYVLAKEFEVKSVRIILSGKRNGLTENEIRERVRDTYV